MVYRLFSVVLLLIGLFVVFIFTPLTLMVPSGQNRGAESYFAAAVSLAIGAGLFIASWLISKKK